MKTSELTGTALDWTVAKCEGIEVEYIDDSITRCLLMKPSGSGIFAPSSNWAQGGEIIEREKIDLNWDLTLTHRVDGLWFASVGSGDDVTATTPLIAAMRAYVASKFGDEVAVPEELIDVYL